MFSPTGSSKIAFSQSTDAGEVGDQFRAEQVPQFGHQLVHR